MAVELTQEQIDQWVAVSKVAHNARKWSVDGVDLAAKDAEMDAAREADKADPAKGQEMMAVFSEAIGNVLVDGFLTVDGWAKMPEAFYPMHDARFGGHVIWDEASQKGIWDVVAQIYGTDGKMSKEAFMGMFGTMRSKIMPLVKA